MALAVWSQLACIALGLDCQIGRVVKHILTRVDTQWLYNCLGVDIFCPIAVTRLLFSRGKALGEIIKKSSTKEKPSMYCSIKSIPEASTVDSQLIFAYVQDQAFESFLLVFI